MMRWLAICVMVLLFGLAMPTGGAAAQESRLVIALDTEPERLDPLTIRNPLTFRVSRQIFESLIGLDDKGEIQPRLARSWSTNDFQTWRFEIRDDVKFHVSEIFGYSGSTRLLTAEDVAWSLAAYCAPGAYSSFILIDSLKGCAARNSGATESVDGIRVIGPTTIELVLIDSEPFFLSRLSGASLAIFPKESSSAKFKDVWGLSLAVGTGPYRLVSRSDVEVVLESNPDYWDRARRPSIKNIIFRVIKSPSARVTELLKGNLNILPIGPDLLPTFMGPDGELKVAYRDHLTVKVFPTLNIHLIGFNVERIPDEHLRRAMSFGTNREELAALLAGGFAQVTGGIVPPAMRGYAPVINEPLYRPDKAAEELRLSSYDGKPIELFVHDLANSERLGEVFQEQMKKIGVTVKLTKLDFGGVIDRMVKGDAPMFSMFFEIAFSSPEPLLINLFSASKIPVPNFWKYSNPAIDEALAGLRHMPSEIERLAKAAEIEREIVDTAPAIFLFSAQHVVVYSRNIENLSVNPHEHYQLEMARLTQ